MKGIYGLPAELSRVAVSNPANTPYSLERQVTPLGDSVIQGGLIPRLNPPI